MLNTRLPLAPAYEKAIWSALLTSVVVGILCALMLDGGMLGKRWGVALLAFWIGVVLVILRRPHAPSRIDLAYIRWGFVLVFALTIMLADMIRPLIARP